MKRHCASCKKDVYTDAEICEHCGAKIIIIKSYKSKAVATLLTIFLGFIGGQHFYLGNIARAIIFVVLFFSILGIPINLLWSFIDLIILVCMSDVEFQDKYRIKDVS